MSFWNAFANPYVLFSCKGLCDKYSELPEFFAVTSCVIINFSNNVGLFVFAIMNYDPDILLFIMNLQAWAVYLLSNAIAEAIAEKPPHPLCNPSWNLPNPTLSVISFYYMNLMLLNILFNIGPKLYKWFILSITLILIYVSWGLMGMVDSGGMIMSILLGSSMGLLFGLMTKSILYYKFDAMVRWKLFSWLGLKNRICNSRVFINALNN